MMDYIYKLFSQKNIDYEKEDILFKEYMETICDTKCQGCNGKLRPKFIFAKNGCCFVCQYDVMYMPDSCVYCGTGLFRNREIFCSIKCGKTMLARNHREFQEYMLRGDVLNELRNVHIKMLSNVNHINDIDRVF